MIKGLDRFQTKAEALIFVRENVQGCISAERYLQEHVPKESYYQKKIMDYVKIAYPDAFVWKGGGWGIQPPRHPGCICCYLW